MGERLEIEIPPQLTEPLLQYASETELPVEDIVETALRNYLERSQDNAYLPVQVWQRAISSAGHRSRLCRMHIS